jgi:hypothetical protein
MTARTITSFTRKGRIGEIDDDPAEYEHWNMLGDEERCTTAWNLVVEAYELQGRDPSELRFQRSATHTKRKGR